MPSVETLDKILRGGTELERQIFRALNQPERWLRMRQGEAIPGPLTMEVSGKGAEWKRIFCQTNPSSAKWARGLSLAEKRHPLVTTHGE